MTQNSVSYQWSTLFCIFLLVYASWLDGKNGYVRNRFWLAAFLVACLSSVSSCLTSGTATTFVNVLFSVALALLISMALFKLKIFGGSDAKALIILSIFIPTLTPLWRSPLVPLFTSLSVTINLLLLLGAIVVVNAIRNLVLCFAGEKGLLSADAPRAKKLMFLSAYKISHSLDRHHRDIQVIRNDGREPAYIIVKRGTSRRVRAGSNDSKTTKTSHNQRGTELWLDKLKIPLIPVLTLSLLLSLVWGDVLTPLAV